MLVTFTCPAYADITMFGDIAVQLIRMMGHSGTVPSALSAEDVPSALEHLQAAVAMSTQSAVPEVDEEGEPVVSLSHRALPLIQLLKAAVRDGCHVMWDGQ
ncbi:MAG: DUF1840 domain-containing protein [Gammaproteobacteria bacterium]|nr:DUF1840 domain-containing protein [Gammaproteobacteria bacterium]